MVVVEWLLSGRKLFPGQSTPGKMGLWVDFWGNGSRGRDQLGRRMNLVVAKTMSTVQLLLAKVQERFIWPDIMFMIIRSVEYIFGPHLPKTNNVLPNTNSPSSFPSDRRNRRCPEHPSPPVTTCQLPLLSTFTRIISQAPTFCPSFAASSSTSNDDDHREPSNRGTAHNLPFKRHDDQRFTHRAPRSHRRRRHPTSRATQSRQADPTAWLPDVEPQPHHQTKPNTQQPQT